LSTFEGRCFKTQKERKHFLKTYREEFIKGLNNSIRYKLNQFYKENYEKH